jgi:phage terminase large subunit
MIEVDWHRPDYAAIFRARLENLDNIRAHPQDLDAIKAYYRANLADFISDWGITFDPRNAERGLPTTIPFVLFPKQREWIDWVLERWHSGEPGICEKSRDMGVSWLSIALSCALCIFNHGLSIGFGSRKSEYVDKLGDLKSLLPKARMFTANLPEEFRAGFVEWRDAPLMRMLFPETGSMIGGEGGDDIGRGDRRAIYFVDEFAHFERAELVEASLSQTTNCRIDMSSVRGMNNPFAKKRWEGKVKLFIFDWRDDPRKDQAWYDKQCAELDPVVVAQEIDRDYSASVHGIVIPGAWVRSALDACEKLGIPPTGARGISLDVADEGVDKNATCRNHGVEIEESREWTGKGGDIFATVERVFEVCVANGYWEFDYDADGLGAGVRGDARILNERRTNAHLRPIIATGFRGSEAVLDPDGIVEGTTGREGDKGRTNKDYFQNRKAQGWWGLRRRFQLTHRWVAEGIPCAKDDIVSISRRCPNHMKLVAELSQPTYKTNEVGKIVINKQPNGMPSPNLADAAMIRFAQKRRGALVISDSVLRRAGAMARH